MADPLSQIKDNFHELVSGMENVIQTLEKKKSNLTEEIERLKREKSSPQSFNFISDRVKLDVGGRHYSSTFQTLTAVPDSLLAKVVRGDVPSERGSDGRIFVDRDGRHFRYILNFLRDPHNFKIRIKDKNLMEEVKREAQFYGVEEQMFTSFAPESLDWLSGISIHSFSTQHSSYPASNVLDTGLSYWLSETGTTTDQWIVFDFGKQVFVSKLLIKVDNYECSVKDFSVEVVDGEPEGGVWRPLKEFQAVCGLNCTTDQIFTGIEFKGRYLRLMAKNNWGPGGGSYILITNVKFFGAVI